MSELNLTHSNGNQVKLTTPSTLASHSKTFKLPNSDGTAGQVLTTDGNGNLSWMNKAVAVSLNKLQHLILGDTNPAQSFSNGSETVVTGLKTLVLP